MEDIPDSMLFPGEEELRARTKKRGQIGICTMCSPILLLLVIFLIQSFTPEWVPLAIFLLFVAAVLVGVVVFMYYAMGGRLFFHSLDLIKKTAPDELILKGRYAVAKKGHIFLVAYWGSNTLFFIAYLQSMPAEKPKLKIPRVIWRWEYKIAIDGFKIARTQGHYTLPVSDEDFITGEGILYSLLIESMPPFREMQYPSGQQLLQIASQLDDETSGLGSGMIM